MNHNKQLILNGVLEKMGEYGMDLKLAPIIFEMVLEKNELLKEAAYE